MAKPAFEFELSQAASPNQLGVELQIEMADNLDDLFRAPERTRRGCNWQRRRTGRKPADGKDQALLQSHSYLEVTPQVVYRNGKLRPTQQQPRLARQTHHCRA